MYIRDHFKCVEIHQNILEDMESIAVSIILSPQMSFTVVGLYRPPTLIIHFMINLNLC